MGRSLENDEVAAFPILEAVMVSLLIITTIIFFTSLQRPTTSTDQGGIDLGRLAGDTLGILQTKPLSTPTCSGQPTYTLVQWIGQAENGTRCVSDEVEKFLREVLPIGTQFQLRLDNGVGQAVLVPFNASEIPRAGKAAATYLNPAWRAFATITPNETAYPGQEIAASPVNNATKFTNSTQGIDCIKSPLGASTGPGNVAWLSVWRPTPAPIPARVPANIPYGVWAGYSDAGCTSAPVYLAVGLPNGYMTNYPVYSLQLVVWFGA